jgi:hypothetical protein
MTLPRTTVLYLMGTTRCGSTVLGNLLGQVDGMVHVGELGQIWEEGFLQNFRCGCGAEFDRCPFWRDVFATGFGGADRVDPARLLAVIRSSARMRHALRLATSAGREQVLRETADYTDVMATLYHAVAEVAKARIVVDTSKHPMLAWLAAHHPAIDLRGLHVTRDPRAVAYSWRRKKYDPAKAREMGQESTLSTSATWLGLNGLAVTLGGKPGPGYLRVRYEDFADQPRRVLDQILAWCGEPPSNGLIGADGVFTAVSAHTIAGNPMRFAEGSSRVVADTEWRERMSRRDRVLIECLTWPLLGRFGYALGSRCSTKTQGGRHS